MKVFWDLGKTLIEFKPNDKATAEERVLLDFMATIYGSKAERTPQEQIALEVMYMAGHQKPSEHKHLMLIPGNIPAPQIMCDWYAGKLTPQAARDNMANAIEKAEQQKLLTNQQEKEQITRMLFAVFDPTRIASNIFIIPQALQLLDACKQTEEHDMYVLSNLDAYTFDLIYKGGRLAPVFDVFKKAHIIISAHIGLIKPHRACFDYVKNKYSDKKPVVLIDNQQENTQCAQEYGWIACTLNNGDYKQLRRELIQKNIFTHLIP